MNDLSLGICLGSIVTLGTMLVTWAIADEIQHHRENRRLRLHSKRDAGLRTQRIHWKPPARLSPRRARVEILTTPESLPWKAHDDRPLKDPGPEWPYSVPNLPRHFRR